MSDDAPKRPRKQRSDAMHNRERILLIAQDLLSERPRTAMGTIADAAGVSRGTLYRHFPTRDDLLDALGATTRREAADAQEDALRPAGELARATPTPLSVADVLNKVPPHLLGEQIVAEAHRVAGVTSAALYLADLEGAFLVRLAGAETFPERLTLPLAVGTEIPREGLPALTAAVSEQLAGATCAPLFLRGRAIGVLVAVSSQEVELEDLAYEAAAALALAQEYTDHLDAVRRVRATSPAAEIQQNLLPPRIVRTSGALIAANVLPGYEIGGDWFDYAENPDGTWMAIADTLGTGTRSAAVASVALGALRSARHQRRSLPDTAKLMDAVVRELDLPELTVSTTVARWNAPTATLSWVTCGTYGPIVIDADGNGTRLPGSHAAALGASGGLGDVTQHDRRLQTGNRIILASDGVIARTEPETDTLTIDGLVDAVRSAPPGSAAGTVHAIQDVLHAHDPGPLDNDATLIVVVPT